MLLVALPANPVAGAAWQPQTRHPARRRASGVGPVGGGNDDDL